VSEEQLSDKSQLPLGRSGEILNICMTFLTILSLGAAFFSYAQIGVKGSARWIDFCLSIVLGGSDGIPYGSLSCLEYSPCKVVYVPMTLFRECLNKLCGRRTHFGHRKIL
jgi:hypothetical protein